MTVKLINPPTLATRGGYSQGPALGLQMAELIGSGRTSLAMDRFDPKRFLT